MMIQFSIMLSFRSCVKDINTIYVSPYKFTLKTIFSEVGQKLNVVLINITENKGLKRDVLRN